MRRLVLPAVASTTLLVSGLLMVAAAYERWWPTCKPGAYDADACLALQDHRYDFSFVAEPWEPVGDAAQLAGLSWLLLAVGLLVVPSVLSRRPRPLTWIIGFVLALGYVELGLEALLSGLRGEVVALSGPNDTPYGWLLVAGPFLAVCWWFCAVAVDWRPGNGWKLGTAFVLVLASPLPALVVVGPAVVGYTSYDTAPWVEAVGGWTLVIAAVLVWPAARCPDQPRSATPETRPDAPADGRAPLTSVAPDGVWSGAISAQSPEDPAAEAGR